MRVFGVGVERCYYRDGYHAAVLQCGLIVCLSCGLVVKVEVVKKIANAVYYRKTIIFLALFFK